MSTQCYIRTAIEEQGCSSDWLSTSETWKMDLKSHRRAGFGCGAAVATSQGKRAVDGQCSLRHARSHSQCSAISITSESSAPNMVYHRRIPLKGPPSPSCAPVPANMSPATINSVYERRHQKSAATNFLTVASTHISNDACTSAVESENPLESTKAIDVVADDRGSDVKDKINKIVELHSVDDSCSSSMIRMDLRSGPLKNGIDDTDECSSSGMVVTNVTGDDLLISPKYLCISILRSHGLLSDAGVNRADASEESPPSCSGSRNSRSCNVCALPGLVKDMLICDECEEAFHLPCCDRSIRSRPVDEWFCQSCFNKKHKLLKETMVRRSSIIMSEIFPVAIEGDLSAIEVMLRDNELHTTGVRVGKGFQAIVPEWSGPITKDVNDVLESMELDPSDHGYMHGLISSKPASSNYIGNWLQCREVIVGVEESIDGTICGKWRRFLVVPRIRSKDINLQSVVEKGLEVGVPLFEAQTDKQDCFSSVFWDPTDADCAAPQELETEEVLKQLKYIEMLRPMLAAKRRKLQTCISNSSLISTEDTSNCTTHSENWAVKAS